MPKSLSRFAQACFGSTLLLCGALSHADGNAVGKIYQPYIEQLGTEIEFELLDESAGDRFEGETYRLGLGHSLGNMLFAELSILAERKSGGDPHMKAYEAEIKWQLTEQGEYAADFGVMLEVERDAERNIWETAGILLVSKEFGRFAGTANAAVKFEEGEKIKSEWEAALALQWRYRWRQGFEPALEYFKAEDTNALGPVLSGKIRTGIGRAWRWELGILFGLDATSVDRTLKARLEYEF